MGDTEHTRTHDVKDAGAPVAEAGQTTLAGTPAALEASPAPSPPPSQAVMDIREAGMTPEEAIAASTQAAAENKAKTGGERGGAARAAAVARFRWLLILFLSLAATLTWAIEAQYSGRPFHWPAWGLLAGAVVLTIPTARILRLPTRGGLAALLWSATFFISAFYGPPETIFNNIPAALSWAGLLTLVIFFVAVAIWRKVGRRAILDLVLAAVLIYAALAPLWSLVDNLAAGGSLALNFKILSASPSFLTNHLPWFLWPMTIMVAGILPLAAFFALWDQVSALRRKGGRHGGNFFLALAFIGLMPYGLLVFSQTMAEKPAWALSLRTLWPGAVTGAGESPPPPQPGDWPAPDEGDQPAPVWPSDEAEPQPPLTGEPAVPAPAETGEPALNEPAPTDPAPEETSAAPPAVPDAQTAPAAPSTATDDRLRAAEERLTELSERLEELERKLNALNPQPAPEAPPAAPPDDPAGDDLAPSVNGVRFTLIGC